MASRSGAVKQQVAPTQEMEEHEQRILEIAIDAFGDATKAEEWLREPNVRTGGCPPSEIINTPEGLKSVEMVLNQIKYAIFA